VIERYDIVRFVRAERLGRLGHVARMSEERMRKVSCWGDYCAEAVSHDHVQDGWTMW
jgi:hypothetical protein